MCNEEYFESKLFIIEFLDYFYEQYELLIQRYNKFKELRDNQIFNIDMETYVDMIIVQLRALLFDDSGNGQITARSYTVDNVLKLVARKNEKERIDNMRNAPFIRGVQLCSECLANYDCVQDLEGCKVKEDLSVRDVIKIIADKTICHYDSYYRSNSSRWESIQFLRRQLIDKNEPHNIDFIIESLIDVFHENKTIDYEN